MKAAITILFFAVLFLTSCGRNHGTTCLNYGFTPGTDAMRSCIMAQDLAARERRLSRLREIRIKSRIRRSKE